MAKPLTREDMRVQINQHLEKVIKKNPDVTYALLTIYNPQKGLKEQFAVGNRSLKSDDKVKVSDQFHGASIGKSMLATVYGQLVSEKVISFDDKVRDYLPSELIEGLFVTNSPTIRHLLNHTSGVNDFFEGKVSDGLSPLMKLQRDPDHMFTSQELLDITRHYQRPVGRPGEKFLYSDTGYILLGLLLEHLLSEPYGTILKERIFDPLGMTDSYLWSENQSPLLGLHYRGVDYSDKRALSLDAFGGGGVVTTMDDLIKFLDGLQTNKILSQEIYGELTTFNQKYERGILYGMGFMKFVVNTLTIVPLGITNFHGAIGSTGAYAMVDKNGTYWVANFGAFGFVSKSIEHLIRLQLLVKKMKL